MNRGIASFFLISCIALLFSGCVASKHAADTQAGLQGDQLTVGTVQKEIRKGMSGAVVAEVLGSPNIVSTVLSLFVSKRFKTPCFFNS